MGETAIKLEEQCNLTLVKSLLNKLNLENENEATLHETLTKLKARIKKNLVKNSYDYTIKIGKYNYGRLYPNKGGVCYANIDKNLRSYLAREYYQYIDIVGCHSNIIKSLCIHYEVECKELTLFCADKKAYTEKNDIDKNTVNKLINCDTLNNNNPLLNDIHRCIYKKDSGIFYNLCQEDYFIPLLTKITKEAEKTKDKNKNIQGKFMSLVLQTIETDIIKKAFKFLQERDMTPNGYIYDGLLIKKDKQVDLEQLNEFLACKYDFGINFEMTPKFEFETFDITEQYNEIFDREIDEAPEELDGEEGVPNLTDNEVAIAVLNENQGRVINNNGLLYAYDCNFWTNDLKHVFKIWLSKSKVDINRNRMKPSMLVNGKTSSWSYFILQMITLCHINLDIIDVLDKQKNIISFKNGIYNLSTRKFHKYDEEIINYSTLCINRDFPIRKDNIISELKIILLGIFDNNEALLNEVFTYISRSIGNNVEDKLAMLLVGERNSGKGLIISMLEKTFSGVCATMLAGGFNSKSINMESAERKNGFLEPMCNKLICFIQEIDPKTPFDGAIWRTAVSGGDEIIYREAYGRTHTKHIKAGLVLTSNVVLTYDQNNSGETLLVCNMPCQFKDVLPDDLSIERGYIVKQGDQAVKRKCGEIDYCNALLFIIFDLYTDVKPIYPLMREATQMITAVEEEADTGKDLYNKIIELFDLTPLVQKNELTTTSVHRKLKNIRQEFTPNKIANVLASKGVKTKKIKGTYFYYGIIEKTYFDK